MDELSYKKKLLNKRLYKIDSLKEIVKDHDLLKKSSLDDIVSIIWAGKYLNKDLYQVMQKKYRLSYKKSKEVIDKINSFLGKEFLKKYPSICKEREKR